MSSPVLRQRSDAYETKRVKYIRILETLTFNSLIRRVLKEPGPRIVIFNTVQNAAIFADKIKTDGADVLHISTALSPQDREVLLKRVNYKFKNDEKKWTLVGTSCLEAGMDFPGFACVFRQGASLRSLLQSGGRGNREGKLATTPIYDFELKDINLSNEHPGFRDSSRTLEKLWKRGYIEKYNKGKITSSDLCTIAVKMELYGNNKIIEESKSYIKKENSHEFKSLGDKKEEGSFRVIESDTRLVVVDKGIVAKLEAGEEVNPRQVVRSSVQIWATKIEKLGLNKIVGHPDMYKWDTVYDPNFLGYMAGVLPIIYINANGYTII